MKLRSLEGLFVRFRDRSDGAALAAVFDATSKELFEVACHLVRDPSGAEDLVQATFLAAIRRRDRYDGKSPLKAWLYGILWREAAKARRIAARRVDPRELAARESVEPIAELESAEVLIAVQHALERLPRRYREVLEPIVRDGRSADDVARELGRSPGTVRSQVHRGMQQLRRALPAERATSPAWIAMSMRGMANVRERVLTGAKASMLGSSTSSAATVASTVGSALISKTVVVAASIALAAVGAGWFALAHTSNSQRDTSTAHPDVLAQAPSSAATAAGITDSPGQVREPAGANQTSTRATSDAVADPDDAIRRWLARFNEMPDDWRHGLGVAMQIMRLAPDEGLRIISGVWPGLTVAAKESVVKAFAENGHVRVLPVLHLAATDRALSVQARAFTYLKPYAFRHFATDFDAYLSWAATYKDMPVARVLTENARRFVADHLSRPPSEIAADMRSLSPMNLDVGTRAHVDVAAELRTSGGLRLLESCLLSDDLQAKKIALEWTRNMNPEEQWLRTWVLPMIEPGSDAELELVVRALGALERPDCTFARDTIIAFLKRCRGDDAPQATAAARTLATIGDPVAIPAMIEVMLNDESGKLSYEVGYSGLARMTGVVWDEHQNGEWWLDWWNKNRGRFAPEVAAISIRR